MQKRNGITKLYLGCMYSGKTTTVLAKAREAMIGLRKVCVIKWSKDTRYAADLASSHDGRRMRAILVENLLEDPPGLPADVEFIAIDEGQFMHGLADFCLRQNALGRDVVVAALNSYADEYRTMWMPVMELIPHAIVKTLTGTCTLCQAPSLCSRRLVPMKSHSERVEIGGSDKYIATCIACYNAPIDPDVLRRQQDVLRNIKEDEFSA